MKPTHVSNYLTLCDEKLKKIRDVDINCHLVAVSGRLESLADDFEGVSDRLL